MNKLPFTPLRNNQAFLNYFKDELSKFFDRKINVKEGLYANEFNYTVKIKFSEGSRLTFKNAFYVTKVMEQLEPVNPDYEQDNNIYAVFTEHLGYYFFYGETVKSIKMRNSKHKSLALD